MIIFQNIANTYYLLIKTLRVVQLKDKYKFVQLIFLLLVQSILDVLTIASIIPLMFILEGKENLIDNISVFLNKINIVNIDMNINSLLIYIPTLVILIMIVSTISRIFIVFKTNIFIEDIRYSISSKLINNYINSNFNNKDTGEVAKLILSEVDQFIIIVFQPTILMLTNIFLLFGILVYIFSVNINASFLSILVLIGFYFFFYIFSKKILNLEGFKSEKANKGRFKTGIESFQSIKDIKIYSAENYFSKKFKKFSKEFAMTNSIYNSLVASPKYLLEMIVFIILSFSILIMASRDLINLNSIPLLATFAFSAYKAQPALSNIIYGINSLEYGSKIINNLNSEINFKDKKLIYSKSSSTLFKPIHNKNISLKIENLYFKYKNNKGVHDINLEIYSPSLFILYGKSGSGKSTLLDLISGLQKQQKGKIIFNSKIFKNREPRISYLHQDHSLIDASIAENVAFGISKNNIDFENLKSSLVMAEIFDYVSSLKNSFFENVGEKGNNLSIGQKQRIALARALYFKPDILLLDEPTSALDRQNELKIIDTIVKISKNITVIMSTHKLNNLPKELRLGFINASNNFIIKKVSDFI